MNDTATRGAAEAREREPHARDGQRADRERRRRRQNAPAEIAQVQVASVHGRAGLAHLGVQHHPDGGGFGTHRERGADVPDDRTNHVALPLAVRPRNFAPRRSRRALA
jgi:hypothetical protein